MSETNCANPHDSALAVLRERERELDGEIQGHQRQIELASARRDELLDLIATLSRKPRTRRPRSVAETLNGGSDGVMPEHKPADTFRPTVFAVPATEPGDPAEAA